MYVLGTAGHVDHGKSALIEALTGIDPDRLAEEKVRGLTIDLGFAWLELPSGREIGIVDVPGHERFVHNMLAGVGSIDATIFVVAANEGWMPQSEEHLQILDLLGARGGIVALTKIDTVDAEALALAETEIADRIAGTALHGARVVRVSARTGEGLGDLKADLDRLLEGIPPSPDDGRPRLFVDRSFTIKGAGTVVTGTLTGGSLALDDDVEVLPPGVRARIRGIQTHRRARERAEPGSRVALNVAGLERHEIARGNAVVRAGQWRPTRLLGVRLRAVRTLDHALSGRGAFKVHTGAAETDARLTLLDATSLRAGEEAFARIALGEDVVATEGDRFVLRDTGRRETVAGGVIFDAHPMPGRPVREIVLERLRARAEADPRDAGEFAIAERGAVSVDEVVPIAGRPDPPGAVRLRSYVAHPTWLEQAAARITDALGAFHRQEPLFRGMPRDEARRKAGFADARLFAEIVEHRPDIFEADGALLRLTWHRVTLSPDQERGRDAVLREAAGMSPPSLSHLEKAHGAKLVRALIDAGDLVKVAEDLIFASHSLDEAKDAIARAISKDGPLPASSIREMLGTSRKYAIPLLEYLDANGFTKREGDLRTLRPSPRAPQPG